MYIIWFVNKLVYRYIKGSHLLLSRTICGRSGFLVWLWFLV